MSSTVNNQRSIANSKFFNKLGHPNAYALTCGYSRTWQKPESTIKLWHESDHYHVRENHRDTSQILAWESFRTLSQAMKFIQSLKKESL